MTKQFYYDHGYQTLDDDRVLLWRLLNGNLVHETRVVHPMLLAFKLDALINSLMDMPSDELKKQTNELLARLEMQPQKMSDTLDILRYAKPVTE